MTGPLELWGDNRPYRLTNTTRLSRLQAKSGPTLSKPARAFIQMNFKNPLRLYHTSSHSQWSGAHESRTRSRPFESPLRCDPGSSDRLVSASQALLRTRRSTLPAERRVRRSCLPVDPGQRCRREKPQRVSTSKRRGGRAKLFALRLQVQAAYFGDEVGVRNCAPVRRHGDHPMARLRQSGRQAALQARYHQ